jgi:hypothetical protein
MTTSDDNYQQSPLARAVAKARGDILTEADMKASIDFLNEAAGKIQAFSGSLEAEQPASLQLLIEFREHLNQRISELSTPSSPPPADSLRFVNANVYTQSDMDAALTKAIADERERCAKVADAVVADIDSITEPTAHGYGKRTAGLQIAAAIRRDDTADTQTEGAKK